MNEDIVIIMLRFGKSRLIEGFTQQDLITYLTNKGFQLEEVRNIIGLYFNNYFAYRLGEEIDVLTTVHYLKPNGYIDLLQIENTLTTQQQAKRANWIATISMIISGLLAIASILMSI